MWRICLWSDNELKYGHGILMKYQCLISLSGKPNFLLFLCEDLGILPLKGKWSRFYLFPTGCAGWYYSEQRCTLPWNHLPSTRSVEAEPIWLCEYRCTVWGREGQRRRLKRGKENKQKRSMWRALVTLWCLILYFCFLKKESQSCWCMEMLRPHSNYAKLNKKELKKWLQLHTHLVERVCHVLHIWMTFNPINVLPA